jgi:class 3 adenylate cyclase
MAASQVVTIVCTDLVGSTELFARLDPAVADQLRETHLSLLRGAVESNGGTEVKNSHDGLMVVFPVTSGALNGAEAMQRAIELHNGMASLPLSIRIGLSHGEVIEDAGDYVGDAVIEADRLCAKASGGQILATEIVRKAAGRRAKQEFVSFGEFEPTDLSDPVAIVEVLWEPVEAIESDGLIPLPAQCVPTPSDGFVGRVAERALLDEALKKVSSEARRHHAFIGGEPGMGKTTLASEFARYAHDDGVIVPVLLSGSHPPSVSNSLCRTLHRRATRRRLATSSFPMSQAPCRPPASWRLSSWSWTTSSGPIPRVCSCSVMWQRRANCRGSSS